MIGRYVLGDPIGEGGMGAVYKASDPELDRVIALKLIGAEHGGAAVRDRLVREAQALARLSHPNVIAVYDVGTSGGDVFIAMEFVDGETLRSWLAERRELQRIVDVFVAAGRGLAAAHAAGLVHRDFKPDNVIVARDGTIKVLDFGLARAADAPPSVEPASALVTDGSLLETPITQAGSVVGTPRYMAPEQLGGRRIDERSDQFGFCVALWEAVYGAPPFSGADFQERGDNIAAGRIVEPPPERAARVPRRLRALMLRGVSAEPERRWPSMAALLAELERDPAAERRRWLQAGAAVVAVAALVGGWLVLKRREVRLCGGARERIGAAWNDTQRQAVRNAFAGTGLSFAADAYTRVAARLDDYAQKWTAQYGDACEATRIRGEQSEEALDLRMSCLSARLEELRAETELFARADARVVEHAVESASLLARPDDCADVAALREPLRPPADPAARAHVEQAQKKMAEAKARQHAGDYAEGARRADDALTAAAASTHKPTEGEALLLRGSLADDLGDYKAAEQLLRNAALAADAGRDDRTAAAALTKLVLVLAERESRLADAHEVARQAEAKLARLDNVDAMRADWLRSMSALAYREKDYPQTLARGEQAAALRARVSGTDSVEYGGALNNVATSLYAFGRNDEAIKTYQRVLELYERAYGPDHPEVGAVVSNLANVYDDVGRHDQARAMYLRALTVTERRLGPDHPDVAMICNNLGGVDLTLHDTGAALELFKRALDIWTRALGAEHPYVAVALVNLGDTYRERGALPEALDYYRRALVLREKRLKPDDPDLATPLAGIGQVLLRRHDAAHALPVLKRAVALREKRTGGDPTTLADMRFALARAAAEAGGGQARAKELALAAREVFAAAHDERLAAVDRWLATVKAR
jgi:eukaryotic-like serine/threonine-protein kinase